MLKHVAIRAEQIGIPFCIVCPPDDLPELVSASGAGKYLTSNEYNPTDMLRCYLTTAKRVGFEGIMRITGDCPLFDPAECRRVLKAFETGLYDFVANDMVRTLPDGFGCEMFTREALEDSERGASTEDREHVSVALVRGCRKGKYEGKNLRSPIPFISGLKLSVDTPDDLLRVQMVDAALPEHKNYSLQETFDAAIRAGVFP